MINTSYLFEEPKAAELVAQRIKARRRRNHRLTYDCMNAIVVGERVKCRGEHKFKSAGRGLATGLALITVLAGRSSSICQICQDYDEEVENDS